jgi:hypothetical protein
MEAIDRVVRKKITLIFALIGVPSVLLLTGGLLATTFGESGHNPTLTALGYVSVVAGFVLFLVHALKAAQLSVWEAQERQKVLSR